MKRKISLHDHVIATDLLFETKAAIKDFAAAITEAASNEAHAFFYEELKKAISYHEELYGFLQGLEVYDAYDVPGQLRRDISYAEEALQQ